MLFINPFIDLLTSLCIHVFHPTITIGIIIRMLFIILCIYYLCFISEKKKINKKYVIILLIYSMLFAVFIYFISGISSVFYNLKELTKVFYFPIILLTYYQLLRYGKLYIKNRQLIQILCIYLVLLFVPFITNTGFNSYAYSKKGEAGWFYSANEIGAILSLLFPFLFLYLRKNYKKISSLLLIAICLICIFSLGTKVPILSLFIFLISTFIWIVYRLIRNKKIFQLISLMGLILIIGIVSVITIPKTTFYENIQIHLKFLKVQHISEIVGDIDTIDHFIFSQRIKFFMDRKQQFKQFAFPYKLFGIGYNSFDNQPFKMVEMDYYDIYFSYGFLGFVIFFAPLFYVLFKNLDKIVKNVDFTKYMFMIGFCLILVLSLFSGHIITSPSVSIYAALCISLLLNYNKEVYKL